MSNNVTDAGAIPLSHSMFGGSAEIPVNVFSKSPQNLTKGPPNPVATESPKIPAAPTIPTYDDDCPSSLLEILSPNDRLAQTLLGRTNYSTYICLVLAAHMADMDKISKAIKIGDFLLASYEERRRYDKGINMRVSDINPRTNSTNNDHQKVPYDDSGSYTIQEIKTKLQSIYGPLTAEFECIPPYRDRAYSVSRKNPPYTAQDLLNCMSRFRFDLRPLIVTKARLKQEYGTPNILSLQYTKHKNETDKNYSRRRNIGDTHKIPIHCCSEETISTSLDGVSVCINIILKRIVTNIVLSTLSTLETMEIDKETMEEMNYPKERIPYGFKTKGRMRLDAAHVYETITMNTGTFLSRYDDDSDDDVFDIRDDIPTIIVNKEKNIKTDDDEHHGEESGVEYGGVSVKLENNTTT